MQIGNIDMLYIMRILLILFTSVLLVNFSYGNEMITSLRAKADQGVAQAQFDLGAAYYTGEGVAQNKVEAVKLFKLDADQGLAQAQDILVTA